MTRLERVLDLLERYDEITQAAVNSCSGILAHRVAAKLQEEKEKLTKELIEHGCRRKN